MNVNAVAFAWGDGQHLKGVALVLLAGTFWSISGIVVRLIQHATVWQIVLYRSFSLMLTLTLVILWRQRRGVFRAFRDSGVMAMGAGLGMSMSFACWIFALAHTTVANALFLLTTQPFITAFLARLLLGERISRLTWCMMGLALTGVAVMLSEGLAVGTLFGNLMGIGAAWGLSCFTIALRKGQNLEMFPATWWAGFFATLMAVGVLVRTGAPIELGHWDLGMCIVLGVVQLGFGLMAYTAGSRYLPAAELALLALTEVILGPIWVWLGIGEVPSGWTLLGGAIVLTAVVGQIVYGSQRSEPVSLVQEV